MVGMWVLARAVAGVLGAFALAGCHTAVPVAESDPRQAPPTFTRDIAPIVFEHCSPCHRPGQPAPFALLHYRDLLQRASRVVEVTAQRRMPPWLPEPGHGDFINARRLSEEQIVLIQRWVGGGALEGDPADLPEQPTWTEGWDLGQPDLIVEMPRPYVLLPGDEDVFRNFTIPVDLQSNRFVRALEFRSSNARAVHHAVIAVDATRASRRRDGSDGAPGYGGMMVPTAQSPGGHFLGWTPGRGPMVMPEGMAWRLERGSDLVVQLHLPPTEAPEPVQVSVGLYFSDSAPRYVPVMVRLGSKTIDIPAGAKDYAIEDRYVLPIDVDLLSVYPHAHYLAKEMEGRAALPDGSTRWLIRIRHWDFHWQQDYRFVTPLRLPRGTTISMRYTYDNSDSAPGHHHAPARRVFYGPNSTDEMGDLWLQVLPRSASEGAVLSRTLVERENRANVASGEMLVRHAPDVAEHREFLGNSYLQVGRAEEAAVQLQQALRLSPNDAAARNLLGVALLARGRTVEAIAYLQQAVALQPGDDRLHVNLANALATAGRAGEAIRELQRAIAINPEFAEAHNNLAILLGSGDQVHAAVAHFERAIAINPNYADAHSSLGAVLGNMGRVGQAIRHIERALEISPDHADARNNLVLLRRSVAMAVEHRH